MNTIQTLAEQFTGQVFLDLLTEKLLAESEDFRQGHSNYQAAIAKLRRELGCCISPTVEEVVAAVDQLAASTLLFAGYLGFKMNLDHFHNPMLPNCTWSQVDYNDYLHSNNACMLTDQRDAQIVLSRFCDALPLQQKEIYDTVAEYISFWDVVGAKLAHYCGYLLADATLHRLVPGYCPDVVLTLRYKAMIEEYFGQAMVGSERLKSLCNA